ncbi:MAG: Ppx/GppA family phosphatase [Chloroherpetonaceae bacterium]|nr:Ppx/GppA family phosphatase [Chloroherpetonaceae bacterium]
MRIATIDIGTNTALLLIADLDKETRSIRALCNHHEIIRLGKGVDKERRINGEAIERLVNCLRFYRSFAERYRVETIRAVATSAVRDAQNREEVLAIAKSECGIEIEPLSGEAEAELTFQGAIAGWNDLPEPFLVIDIGGGSTELILGDYGGIWDKTSLDIGSVRLTERFFKSHPPDAPCFNEARRFLAETFAKEISRFIAGRESVVGVAGTIISLAQRAQGLRAFDDEKLHGYALSHSIVDSELDFFKSHRIEEIIESGTEPGRADIITAGALILWEFMRVFGAKRITVSAQGLRYGVAARELRRL